MSAGGGATNAVVLHRARAGGARRLRVRVRDPGHDRRRRLDERGRVRRRLLAGARARARRHRGRRRVAHAARARPDVPALDVARRPGRRAGRAAADAARAVDEIKATIGELQARRKAAQPTNKRTFGSVFKNPDHDLTAGRMLEACGLKGHRIGGAQISPMHANFIENAGDARSEDAVALMIEARRRAFEQYGVELEHEVRFLEPARAAARPVGGSVDRGEVRVVSRPPRQSPAREAVARLPSRARSRRAAAVRPLDRRRARGRRRRGARVRRRARDVGLRRADDRGARRRSEARAARRERARAAAGREPAQGARATRCERLATSLPSVAGVTYDRAFPNTLRVVVQAEEPVGRRAPRRARVARLATRTPDGAHRPAHAPQAAAHLARAARSASPSARRSRPARGAEEVGAASTRCAARRSRGRSARVRQVDGQWTYVLRGGVQIRVGDRTRPPAEARGRGRDPAPHADLRLPRRQRSRSARSPTRTVKSQVEVEICGENLVDNPDTWPYIATLHRPRPPLSSTTA